MANRAILMMILFICLAANASSQGYMGTISTGTGILEPITVGKSTISPSSVGAVSMMKNLSGTWALDLRGADSRHFDLEVLQKGDLIAGSGEMSSGQQSQAVTVAGYVSGNNPTIFISAIGSLQTYRVKLSYSGSSISGEYDFISQNAASDSGTATGSLTTTAPSGQAKILGSGMNPSATAGAYVGSATKSIS